MHCSVIIYRIAHDVYNYLRMTTSTGGHTNDLIQIQPPANAKAFVLFDAIDNACRTSLHGFAG